MNFDPFVDNPRFSHKVTWTSSSCCEQLTLINAMAIAGDGRLILADYINVRVLVVPLQGSRQIEATTPRLRNKPLAVCLLPGDRQATVTGSQKSLFLIDLPLDLTGGEIRVSNVHTARQYYGIGVTNHFTSALVACCHDDEGGPASVDVITKEGVLLKSIVSDSFLKEPYHLCITDKELFLLDMSERRIFRVSLGTDSVQLDSLDVALQKPSHLAVDPAGNVYVAEKNAKSVLVVSRDMQQRHLLTAASSSHTAVLGPQALCVTGSNVVVSWYGLVSPEPRNEQACVVMVYDFNPN